ncbi:MAG: MATE family efflux transporter [Ruminiclostridium sp.]|nr:MATE family efflux transporter [Ruminiclostridium sp.]
MKDLTRGKPVKVILLFAIPLYIGQLFSLSYGLIDTRIIGSILGGTSLAAVGSTTALSDLLIEFENGIICGFGIIVAKYYGANDEEKMKKAIGGMAVMGVGFTVIISVVCLLFMNTILRLLNVSGSLHDEAFVYISIIIAGMIALSLYSICTAILRSIGDSFTPLVFLVISNVMNIILDILFVKYMHMGVAGAAIATILTQALSALLCLFYIIKKYPEFSLRFSDLKPDGDMLRELLSSGISMGFMLSFVLLGSLALQTTINQLGANIIVAHTGARKATIMFLIPFFVLGSALATYCSQNRGAKEYGRIKKGVSDTLKISAIWCAVVIILVYSSAPVIIRLITATNEPEVINNASLYLKINSALFFLPAMICILRNSMQGLGDTKTPLISSLIELVGKVLIAFILVPVIRYLGVIVAEPIVWAVMIIPLLIRWKKTDFHQLQSSG